MKVAILGWGIDTQDVVPYLLKQGAKITVFDRKGDLGDLGSFGNLGIIWKLGREDFGDLTGFDLIVRNPAVYRFRPEIVAAEKAGVEISSKIKLFFDLCPATIIGVTGTKGKGTTATLICEMLKKAGKKVFLGGNIGTGIFDKLDQLDKFGRDAWVVLELSSFQLIDLHRSPHIGVVLMVTTEHQDWHASAGEYVNAKKSIVAYQSGKDFAIINDDFSNSVEIGRTGKGRKVFFSRKKKVENGLFVAGGVVRGVGDFGDFGDFGAEEIRLRGEHNQENIMAAILAAQAAGVQINIIKEAIRRFKGLEHRLEEAGEVKGVKFYNDSFSTTPETAIAAIKSFSEPVILIAGGSEKKSDYTKLGKEIVRAGNVKGVILIGEMAGKIEKAIRKASRSFKLLKLPKGLGMEEIVKMAYNDAVKDDVILLSPACASFDMFKNYKDRGEQFKREARRLSGR